MELAAELQISISLYLLLFSIFGRSDVIARNNYSFVMYDVCDTRDFSVLKYELFLWLVQAVGGESITFALRVPTWKIVTIVLSGRSVSGGVQGNAAGVLSANLWIITERGDCK